jgi:uncharacterized protein YodC (DUF2158 family)
MARTLTTALRNAIDIDGSFRMRIKAEIYPSRIYFEAITSDYPTSVHDEVGLPDDPVKQDIAYSSVDGGLVTFYVDDSTLRYAKQGSSSGTSTGYSADSKPGVVGSTLFACYGSTLTRYSINWSGPSLSPATSITPDYTVYAVHAISSTECIALCSDQGGLRVLYLSGTTEKYSPGRFMFHTAIKPTPKTDKEIREGKVDDTRTLLQKAIHSGAAKLGTKIFIYITNAFSGMVEGCYYDTDTGTWSTIFTVLATDLQVSLCEFRISNAFERNGTIFMAGQFRRTDSLDDTIQPHSLVLFSTNGKTFSVNRNTLVSDIGYRFLATVGADGNFYLGNCNRVCHTPVTWVFDGLNGTVGTKVDISEDNIKGYGDGDLAKCTSFALRSGLFEYFPINNPSVIQGARLVVYAGYDVAVSTEWSKYATYIIDGIDYQLGVGKRGTVINATNEAVWNLTGLSMPFYAEILGKSCQFDPMLEGVSMLSSVGNGCIARSSLSVDFWDSVGYTNTTEGIAGIDMMVGGGVDYYITSTTTDHYLGIITRSELAEACGLSENPTITATTIALKIYGWSVDTIANDNDAVYPIIITEDDEGNETTHIANSDSYWPCTYTTTEGGQEPISISMPMGTTFTIGHKIKKVGVAFWQDHCTYFNIARIDIVSGIKAYYPLYGADSPWETQEKWGYYKLPRRGKPYIMIASGPYNAFNFSLAGRFKDSHSNIDGYIHSYCGIVGHCEDGLNYTVARYCRQHNKVQLIQCRDGTETQLKESATIPFTVNETYQIRFDHKDGYYEIYLFDDATGYFKEVLGGYYWLTANGYMFTSDIVSMRSGIYGYVATPMARITGYCEVGDESGVTADGIPFDPLWDVYDWPSSGRAKIMDNIYEYYSIVTQPTIPRGPYQFRQMADYSQIDTPHGLMGDGPGLDARDFDWTGEVDHSTLNDGYIIAINSGANFRCNGTEWQVWTDNAGSQVFLRNRMRYYSDNPMIGKTYSSLANKVWIVGGLLGDYTNPTSPIKVTLKEGEKMTHGEGSFVTYEPVVNGEILCYWYIGSGGEDDATVEDLIQRICDLSGARCNFPGDYTVSSLGISGSPQTIVTTPYAEGFDLSFEIASFTSGSISIRFNATLNPDNYENKASFVDDTHLIVNIAALGSGGFRYTLSSYDSNTVIYSSNWLSGTSAQKFRVMCMKDNIGLYQNGAWVTTIPTDEIVYGPELDIEIYASGSMTLTNIRETDLSDWREAIYLDLETDGMSALGSVIQQRPVEMMAKSDGSFNFMYDPIRHTITAIRQPRVHRYVYSVPSDGASDAIIYGLKDVKTIINLYFAKVLGFATKLMRMPDLGVGAIRAAHIILQRTLENYRKHNLSIRPDLEVEPGDIYSFSYAIAGSTHVETADIIVESVSFDFRASGTKIKATMDLIGREVYP